jgi:sortase A
MRSKTGIFLMIVGALLVAAAVTLALFNYCEDRAAGEAAMSVLSDLEKSIAENAGQSSASSTGDSTADNSVSEQQRRIQGNNAATEHVIANKDSLVTVSEDESSQKPGSLYVDDHYYVGIITIPELGIKLPVIDSYIGDNLRYAPCLYSGYVDSQMIICAHNYNTHFGRIKELESGSVVIFTDIYGNDYRYYVMDIEIVPGDDSNKMEAGEWDLSLFTCTFDGTDRVTVRCCHEQND